MRNQQHETNRIVRDQTNQSAVSRENLCLANQMILAMKTESQWVKTDQWA